MDTKTTNRSRSTSPLRDAATRLAAARRAFGTWRHRSLKKDLQILARIRRGWERPLA